MSNKTILIVAGRDDPDAVVDETVHFGDDDEVIVTEIDPTDGTELRGYNPDLIILTTTVSSNVMQRVLEPMVAIGGEIIQLN